MTTLDPTPIDRPTDPATPIGPVTPVRGAARAITLTHLEEFGDILVAVVRDPGPAVAALLSCRLHEAISAAGPAVSVVVDLGGLPGAGAADPVIARVLRCARESATARGVPLRLVGES